MRIFRTLPVVSSPKFLAVLFLFSLFGLSLPAQQAAKASSESDPAEQHFQAAQTFQLTGDLTRAGNEYHSAISAGLQRLGNIRISEANYGEAATLLSTAVKIDSANVDATIDLAVAHFYTGEFDKAKSSIEPIFDREPSNYRVLNLMGKIEFMKGNFQQASDHLQAALAQKADFDVAYSLALADLQLKKLPQASVLFDEMKASMKSSPELHMLIGRAYRQSGYPEQAAGEFEKAIALDPKYPHVHSLLGVAYLMEGDQRYAQAKQQFEIQLGIDPNDYVSRYYLGVVEFNQHDLSASEANLQLALRQQPDNPDAFFYSGRIHLLQGHLDSAAASLRKAIALSSQPHRDISHLAEAHSFLAEVLARQGKGDEAAAETARAEQLQAAPPPVATQPATSYPVPGVASGSDPQDVRNMMTQAPGASAPRSSREREYVKSVSKLLGEAYHNLGVIEARSTRYANATDDFADAAHWNPDIESLDRNWGMAAFRAERYEQATAPLQRQLRRTPSDAVVRQMLAVSYFMTDDLSKCVATFRPILEQLPDNPGMLYAAGTALVRTGDSATARQLFSRMLEHGSNLPEVHLVLGEAHAEQLQYSEALLEFDRALEMNPHLPDAHYYAGMVYFKQGKMDQAAQEFSAELANSRSIPAMYQLAYVQLQQHRPEEAIRLLTDIVTEKPSYGDAQYQLGKALLEKGEINAAIQHIEMSTRLQPSESYGFYQLSIAYRRAGRLQDSDRALHRYQELKDKNSRKPAPGGGT